MNKDSQVLKALTDNNMHVHLIEENEKLPFHVTNLDTHYIMKGSNIVFHGNLQMVESFVLAL